MDNKEYAFSEGEKAGEAARQKDQTRVSFFIDAFRKWLFYNSTPENKSILQSEFDKGYKEGYGLPFGGYR